MKLFIRPSFAGYDHIVKNLIFESCRFNIQSQDRCYKTQKFSFKTLVNSFTERTHNCGQLSRDDVGKRVSLSGWVQYTRFDNKIIAIRDSYGVIQCVLDSSQQNLRKFKLHNESVIHVTGAVRARPHDKVNQNISTGEVEIVADDVRILSLANKDLPILTRSDESSSTTATNRLAHRYLDIRSKDMQQALRIRSKICRTMRNKLYDLDFVECETPTLFNRTPGGANEFPVPTQIPDKFYSLVQSPQQMKQLLMIGGLDRYFQICRCYRDESGRADRQPEFTQFDIELSFTNQTLIMNLVDELIYDLLKSLSNEAESLGTWAGSFDQDLHIRKISYHEAIRRYGSDKPDTRFGWEIEECQDGGLLIEIPYMIEHKAMFEILDVAKSVTNLETNTPDIKFDFDKSVNTSIKVRTSQRTDDARKLLGAIRIGFAKELNNRDKKVFGNDLEFIWVTNFPLFTVNNEGRLESNHHPFTAPTSDTIHLLERNPLLVIGQHYDLVLNGQEVAGGSMRIHDAELQRKIFVDILKIDESAFGYFMEALKSGCPPHGGIAIGLDRLIAILLNRSSIRDVIAFPKTSTGRDLMTNCPEELSANVKRLYHLR